MHNTASQKGVFSVFGKCLRSFGDFISDRVLSSIGCFYWFTGCFMSTSVHLLDSICGYCVSVSDHSLLNSVTAQISIIICQYSAPRDHLSVLISPWSSIITLFSMMICRCSNWHSVIVIAELSMIICQSSNLKDQLSLLYSQWSCAFVCSRWSSVSSTLSVLLNDHMSMLYSVIICQLLTLCGHLAALDSQWSSFNAQLLVLYSMIIYQCSTLNYHLSVLTFHWSYVDAQFSVVIC